jgi:DNA-binding winged helix-turn-helix (wHTH) protein/TolB-like protein
MKPGRFRFAEFELDAASGELLGPGGRHRLEPQPARVLAMLVERAGQLVTREELQREVWPDTHVDFDQGLNYCIRQIRTSLGETAEAARFVETLPRRGYRFVAPVEPLGPAAPPVVSGRPTAARRRLQLGLLGLLLVALLAAWWAFDRRPPSAAAPAIRLAVLPFHGVDRPPTAWEDQLTEALVVALTERGGTRIAVIGPATTAPLARERLPQGELGGRLGAGFVLSGGVRSDGETLFAQLLRSPGGEHLWATTLPLGDPDAIAREVAAAALAALDPAARGTGH